MRQSIDKVNGIWHTGFDRLELLDPEIVTESRPLIRDLINELFGFLVAGDGNYSVRLC